MTGFPDGPVVLLSGDPGGFRGGLALGPTGQFVEEIDGRRRCLDELLVPVWVRQGPQVQKHRHATAGQPDVDQRASDKRVAQAMRPVGRIGDDVLGQRFFGFQEIKAAFTIAAINEVGGDDLVAGLGQFGCNGAIAAGGFPDGAVKGFD